MSNQSEAKHQKALAKQSKNYRLSNCGKHWVLDIQKRNGEICEVKILEQHLERCQNYTWYVSDKNYARTSITIIDYNLGIINKEELDMHTLIANPPANKEVDHINHDQLDNRYDINNKNISNLENKYRFQNQQNRLNAKNSSSIFVGVYKYKASNNWRAQITLKKHFHLGYFDLEEDAAKAFNHAAISANQLTEHLPEDRQNMFLLTGANLELNTAMRFGLVSNLSQDKLDYIKDKISANLK